ncbi:YaiO family outer membrane beta-barrel protein [Flavobacterium sandaracinum]|uniref:YaiO family outer membrane beta-barrel protein n=1 Tax=Flavobacterium sandaracinum TaxID=2541733 RepID=A0A4R5D5U1_9FLAO|nr:YaiO family outer membrane beta-barrel protein [Flavobacterium sandaracinum]TDE06971.1 YaiO family outer membrane beta-barrel protein [Flavobacterium sandaracinum]
MILNKIIKIGSIFIYLLFLCNADATAQKINTDSLLTVIIKDMQTNKNYQKNIERALLGKKIAPNYLDYYLILGRNYDFLQKKDSARYYYNYYIQKNPDNEDTFNYLINLELEDKKFNDAENIIDKALTAYPNNKNFEQKKLSLYQLQKDSKKEYEYLKILQAKYPNDNANTQLILQLESKRKSDRLGLNYSYTTFDRKGYGPWHLMGFQYIRERQWGSLIGSINYADRLSSGQSIADGIQYEAESYFFTGKNNYSLVSAAFSNDLVFPKIRLGYSFYQNFKKGWEGDLGLRYLKTQDGTEFNTIVVGIGKYIGSSWINLRTFIQADKENFYPAITLTMRYYFETRFDYISLTSGYGSSPEDRTTLGQFKERVSLDSYRLGAGYFRMFNNHYLMGLQVNYNDQEYVPNLTQNELELSLMFQYKF